MCTTGRRPERALHKELAASTSRPSAPASSQCCAARSSRRASPRPRPRWAGLQRAPSPPSLLTHACARHRIPRLARARRARRRCRTSGRLLPARRPLPPVKRAGPLVAALPARIFTSRSTRCRSSGVGSCYRLLGLRRGRPPRLGRVRQPRDHPARVRRVERAKGTDAVGRQLAGQSLEAGVPQRLNTPKMLANTTRPSRRPSPHARGWAQPSTSPRRAPRTPTSATRRTTARSRRSTAGRAPPILSILPYAAEDDPDHRRLAASVAELLRRLRGVDGRFVVSVTSVSQFSPTLRSMVGPIIKFIHHGRHTAQVSPHGGGRGCCATSCRGRGTTSLPLFFPCCAGAGRPSALPVLCRPPDQSP